MEEVPVVPFAAPFLISRCGKIKTKTAAYENMEEA